MENQIPARPTHYTKVKTNEIAQRICLHCLKAFKSKHKFNRICAYCLDQIKMISSEHYGISID